MKIISIFISFVIMIGLPLVSPADGQPEDPRGWYRDAVVYEAFMRSFYDSDGDGIGDIKGFIKKLDYLNDGDPKTGTDLEISAIWLMPMFASPSYHGYDVSDYYKINPQYGTNEDFKTLLAEAHKRGIKILIDLVINHTSSKHPVFLEARDNPESPKRDWYVWRKDLPKDWGQPWSPHSPSTSVWHKAGDWYYYGIFYFGMPDLNYRNPEVRAEMKKIAAYWLEMGVDGFRLDAIRYLIEEGPRHGQSDVEGTHKVMAEIHDAAKAAKQDAILVGEVWADIDIVSMYHKSKYNPAQIDSCFNFDLAAAFIDGLRSNSFKKINAVMEITLESYPKGAIDSTFLTNHDMDRIASILNGDLNKLKLGASMLFTFPGVPYMYYGEEIAMLGRKPDEMIRRPMRWEKGEFAGFTTAERPWIKPDRANPDYTVADMQKDKDSLLNHYKTFIRLRNRNIALRRGDYKWVKLPRTNVYAYLRSHEQQNLLVLHNFSSGDLENVTVPENIKIKRDIMTGKEVSTVGSLKAYGTGIFEIELKELKKQEKHVGK